MLWSMQGRHPFILSFNKYVLSISTVPGIALSHGDMAGYKTDINICYHGAYVLMGGDRQTLDKIKTWNV